VLQIQRWYFERTTVLEENQSIYSSTSSRATAVVIAMAYNKHPKLPITILLLLLLLLLPNSRPTIPWQTKTQRTKENNDERMKRSNKAFIVIAIVIDNDIGIDTDIVTDWFVQSSSSSPSITYVFDSFIHTSSWSIFTGIHSWYVILILLSTITATTTTTTTVNSVSVGKWWFVSVLSNFLSLLLWTIYRKSN